MMSMYKPMNRAFLTLVLSMLLANSLLAQSIITYRATQDFTKLTIPNNANYTIDPYHSALSIASTPTDNPGDWAAAEVIFKGGSGVYEIKLTTLDEIDGESSYKISINGIQTGPTFQNQFLNLDSAKDYTVETYILKNQPLRQGDSIRVESNRISNGKIFQTPGVLDYGRGRWTKLELQLIPAIVPILITEQPVDTAVIMGTKAEFRIRASGSGPLSYKWQRNSDSIIVGTDSILSLMPTLADSGSYYFCNISNGASMIRSRNALLVVGQEPCHKTITVESDTINISEGKLVTLKGQTSCAQSFFWSVNSGPAPRILDPETQVLSFPAPRVSLPTVLIYDFNAEFGDTRQSKKVVVRVFDSIPDPLIKLLPSYTWDGKSDLVLIPTLTNKKNLDEASLHPALHYVWNIPDEFADAIQSSDSLVLPPPTKSGNYKITLCVDNGGGADCQTTSVHIALPVKLGVRPLRTGAQPVLQSENMIYWSAPALVRIWDLTGHEIWSYKGLKGDYTKMPARVFHSLRLQQAKMEILSPPF